MYSTPNGIPGMDLDSNGSAGMLCPVATVYHLKGSTLGFSSTNSNSKVKQPGTGKETVSQQSTE